MNVTIWWRWWAIAAFAHVVGVPTVEGLSGRGLANIAVGWLAIAVIVRPDHRVMRTVLAAAIVVSAVVEAPLIGNHWWLAAAVSAAALAARPWRPDPDTEFARRFAPTARVILLVFYSFAAFAKLNTGFLDPIESCARFFANQSLSFWQLPEVSGDNPLAPILPFIALAVELAVPVLLILRPTRRFGVVLAIVFHLVLTLDLRQHFYDFTLALLPLFSLFAPPRLLEDLDRALPRLNLGRGRPWIARFAA
ncbi:MAG: HTTM domain-containing protein, partial [Actinomycetota bacterium]